MLVLVKDISLNHCDTKARFEYASLLRDETRQQYVKEGTSVNNFKGKREFGNNKFCNIYVRGCLCMLFRH